MTKTNLFDFDKCIDLHCLFNMRLDFSTPFSSWFLFLFAFWCELADMDVVVINNFVDFICNSISSHYMVISKKIFAKCQLKNKRKCEQN